MNEMTKHRTWTAEQTPAQREARDRMALFPLGDPNKPEGEGGVEVLFVKGDIWVVRLSLSSLLHQCKVNPNWVALIACDKVGRQTMHIPRHPRSIPENAG